MKYLLLLSTHNNEKNFLEKYESITDSGIDIDLLVVDRGSKDRTKHFLRNNKVARLEMPVHNSYYSAISLGLQYAHQNGYDGVVEFDINGRYKLQDVPYLIATYEKANVDFILGSRFLDKRKKVRGRSKFMSLISRIWIGQKITDPTTRFKLFGKDTLKFYGETSKISVPQPDSIINLLKVGYTFKDVQIEMNKKFKRQHNHKFLKSFYENVIWVMSIMFANPYRKVGKK